MERKSKPIAGTLHKELTCIPEQVGMLTVKEAINVVQIVFTAKDKSIVVREMYYDTKQEAKAAYDNLRI